MNKRSLIFVLAGLVLIVGLAFLPRTQSVKEEVVQEPSSNNKVEEAVRLVQEGDNPMEGVMMLREILEEDPDNLDAIYAMGMLSMQSGQYEKAVQRFTRIIELAPDQIETYRLRGDAYFLFKDIENAKKDYLRFIESSDNEKSVEEVKQRLTQLNE